MQLDSHSGAYAWFNAVFTTLKFLIILSLNLWFLSEDQQDNGIPAQEMYQVLVYAPSSWPWLPTPDVHTCTSQGQPGLVVVQ